MDPIAETIIEILGQEIARRVLRPKDETLAQPEDESIRQVTPTGGLGSEITVHLDQWQGPPCDVVDELYEDQLFDRLIEEE